MTGSTASKREEKAGTAETTESRANPPQSAAFAVVGIGASAGGLEAASLLLGQLPGNTGMAFVLIQHLDPKHESNLGRILAKATPIPVQEATQGLAVQPNNVYVIPRNTTMTVADGVLQLTEEAGFRNILKLLRASFGVDFSGYRDTTVRRRIMRRMVLHIKEDLADYARHLEKDGSELEALYQDILINVTSFFREPETFEALKN